MGGRNCCVKNCRRRSHDHLGRKIPNGITFHCFPAWRRNEGAQISALTQRRRSAWVAAVGRSSITFNHIPKSMRVCSRHFHSGKPAYEMLESDPDWVPSLHMGHSEGNIRRAERLPLSVQSKTRIRTKRKKQRQSTETRWADVLKTTQRESESTGDAARPAVRPWSEVKTLLQSVLQRKTSISEKPHVGAEKKTVHSFRDFFRDGLEASLEASSQSRACSQRPASVFGESQVELNFNLPPLREENQTCGESPSCCLNCVRLQRRIMELEQKLFRLTREKESMQTSPVFNRTPILPNQVLQSPEPVHTEEEGTEWMEPLSPAQVLLHEGDSADKSPPSSLAVSEYDLSKQRYRQGPRFNQTWLKMFWFLRYSPSLDKMWCHVCRLHADKSHQNLALIKGSSIFKLDTIKKHSRRIYHTENLKRYWLHR